MTTPRFFADAQAELMTYARFQASMMRVHDGRPYRAWLEASAAGNGPGAAAASLALVEPPFPDALAHLWAWVLELRQGLGIGMEGLASLTWTTLDAWARRTAREPEPYEVDTLFALDAVLRTDGSTADAEPVTTQPVTKAWPVKPPEVTRD